MYIDLTFYFVTYTRGELGLAAILQVLWGRIEHCVDPDPYFSTLIPALISHCPVREADRLSPAA
jgi:hypothetical protein